MARRDSIMTKPKDSRGTFRRLLSYLGAFKALILLVAVMCVTSNVLSLWGPTREGKWAPRGERDRALRGGEACAGCRYWDWRAGCGRETHECMDGLGVDEVAAAALEMLGK